MINALASSTSSAATSSASSATDTLANAAGSQSLGKDDFLKLLVAQLKNQDPLQPTDNTEFVAQLAQFSSLEQTMGINDRLDKLSQQNSGLVNSEAVNLVGKQATVKGSVIGTDGSGLATPLSFTLNGASASTQVSIVDASGRTIRTMDAGAHAAGLVNLTWDGRDNTGTVQPQGTYSVSVQAKSSSGSAVDVTQRTSGTVTGVSFDQGNAVLHLDSGVQAPVSDLVQVNSTQQ